MDSPTVFVFAPQGSGKTANAEALRAMFGCTAVVDDWEIGSGTFIPDGALVLSSLCPFDLIEHGRKTHGNPGVNEAPMVEGLSWLFATAEKVSRLARETARDEVIAWDEAAVLAKKRLLALMCDEDVLDIAELAGRSDRDLCVSVVAVLLDLTRDIVNEDLIPRDEAERLAKLRLRELLWDADVRAIAALIAETAAGSNSL